MEEKVFIVTRVRNDDNITQQSGQVQGNELDPAYYLDLYLLQILLQVTRSNSIMNAETTL